MADGTGGAAAEGEGGTIGILVGSALGLFEAVGAAGVYCDGTHAISRQAASSDTSLFRTDITTREGGTAPACAVYDAKRDRWKDS